MMAVETFVYLYIIGFGLAAAIAIGLLVAAARRLSRPPSDEPADRSAPRHLSRKP